MANIKITDLTAYADPAATDVLPIVDVGADVTKKVSIQDLLENAGSGTAAAPGIAFDGDSDTGIYRPGANQLALSTNGEGRLFIDSSGNVGIGTTSPNAALTVRQSSASHQIIQISRPNSDIGCLYLGNDSNDDAVISSNNGALRFGQDVSGVLTEYASIDDSGRLLIGTSSDFTGSTASLFQVKNTGSANIAFGREDSTLSSGDAISAFRFYSYGGSSWGEAARIECEADGTHTSSTKPCRLIFFTTADGDSSPTQHLYISSEGYVVPGVDSVIALPDAECGPGLKIVATTVVSDAKIEGVAGSTATRYIAAFSNPNGIVGSISTSGSAAAFNETSDYRLKENITPVTDGIARLQQLKPSRFNFIADPSTVIDGFIAHEVQTVVPEAVTGEKDAVNEEGNPEYQGIDKSKLVPLLTAALQEAIGEIESLKARVAALETP